MKRAQAVTQRVGTGEIGERARIHIGPAKILPSLHGEDDDNGDNDDCMRYISVYKEIQKLKIYGSRHDIACYFPLVQASVQFQVLCIFS